MCSRMIHRGPDDGGMASQGPATLGMRRLAIFDPNNGQQPMRTPDGRFTIVFNGAIYNFRELQVDLEAVGWMFRTRCDTEVLLAALAQWGDDALARLRGMYAFALWDSHAESLTLARDPMGIKPAYYSFSNGRMLFASEISALLASGAVGAQVSAAAVSKYLAWMAVPAPETIYEGIRSLLPGEVLKLRDGAVTTQPGWTLASIPPGRAVCSSREEFVAELRARLNDSIQAHVLADVPVGAFLSGGLDSAVIAGLMSKATGNALKTFSIGFEEDDFSEADEAEATARFLGAVHHSRIVTGQEVAEGISQFLDSCDQPTGDGINTFFVSETAQQGGLKVALSGLGGDELFGGYPSFSTTPKIARWIPMWRALPSPIRSAIVGALSRAGTRERKLAGILANARDAHEIAALSRRVFTAEQQNSVLSPSAAESVGADSFHPALERVRGEVGAAGTHSLVSAWEFRTYMADVLLRDSDVMSMRHSLELRVPFVDRPLLEWLWSQPDEFKTDGRRPKSVLADAAADVLPHGVLSRRKRGFTFPFPIWMRKQLKPFLNDVFSPANVRRSGLFSEAAVGRMWSGFERGGDDKEWTRVWSLAVLIAFVSRSQTRSRS